MKNTSGWSAWVWAAVTLQCVVFLTSAWSCLALAIAWPKYAVYDAQIISVVVRILIQTVVIGLSVVGLWRSKWWGWSLSVLVNGWSSAETLSSLVQYGGVLILQHAPRLILFSVLDIGTLAVLLHRPVRQYFLRNIWSRTVTEGHAAGARISDTNKLLRILIYFVAAVAAMCAVTSFALALMMGEKLGGSRGFFFVLYLGFLVGSFASFVFAVSVTLAARQFGPEKLWVWLLAGVLIAPALELVMIVIARFGQGVASLGYLLSGPAYLYQVWWLVIPSGLVTSLISFELYPWAFTRSSVD